jgi:hypothetical protein
MPYGNLLADVVQGSTANTPPVFKDGNSTEIGTLCRAWVNFNGTGTVAIRASFNVSSITDNGTGHYTINFTTAFVDSNYVMAGTAAYSTSSTTNGRLVNTAARGTTSCGVTTSFASNTNEDEEFVQVAFFR